MTENNLGGEVQNFKAPQKQDEQAISLQEAATQRLNLYQEPPKWFLEANNATESDSHLDMDYLQTNYDGTIHGGIIGVKILFDEQGNINGAAQVNILATRENAKKFLQRDIEEANAGKAWLSLQRVAEGNIWVAPTSSGIDSPYRMPILGTDQYRLQDIAINAVQARQTQNLPARMPTFKGLPDAPTAPK